MATTRRAKVWRETAAHRGVREQAEGLMARHGLEGWTFQWMGRRTAWGLCSYRDRQILISWHWIDGGGWNAAEVLDTILHEIAHALTPRAGHGPAWRAKCREIGARPERCKAAAVAGGELPVGRWQADCPCGNLHAFHRKPRRTYACRITGQRLVYVDTKGQ